MCEKNNSGIAPLEVFPIINKTSGEFEKVLVAINTVMPGNNYSAAGFSVAESTTTDSKGRKILSIQVKFTKKTEEGEYYPIQTVISQQLSLTRSQLEDAGSDQATYIVLEPVIDDSPVFLLNGGLTWCSCSYQGSGWCCFCYRDAGGHTTITHIDVN